MSDAREAAKQVRRMVAGVQVAQVLHVAVTLQLSDLLAEQPRTLEELAAATSTHPPSLQRLLRALQALDIYERDADGRFSNTPLGAALCRGGPAGVAEWTRLVGRPHYWSTWTHLVDSIRTGDNAFMAVQGMSIWEWRRSRPEEQEIFNAAMVGITRAVVAGVVAAYDFSQFSTVADIGGGHGALVAAVLDANPSLRGVLFDQPDVVATAAPIDRCEFVGGSFFDAVPAGLDCYMLKAVIHDWADAESVAILRRCREAARDGSVLLLVEQLVDQAPDPLRTALSDINMLVMPGGQERTTEEYAALLAAAGWSLTRVVPTETDVFVIEAHTA